MESDPRYLIAQATHFADHDVSNGWHAINLELAPGAARRDRLRDLQDRLKDEGRIDAAHFDAPVEFGVATAVVTAAGLGILEKLAAMSSPMFRRFEYAQSLKMPRIRPVPALALPRGLVSGRASEAEHQTTSKEVLAVIDYGCPFMNPLLCSESPAGSTTRVRALWDQQPSRVADARTVPKGFSYGVELSRAQLDAVIRASAGDESSAYESVSYEAMRLRESHGAHTLGMLLDDGVRPRARKRDTARPDVLFVQLPQALLSAPNRAVLSRHVIDALVWIEAHRQCNERVILALGEGSSQGPHDGSSMVEQALRAFTERGPEATKNRVFVAAGNGFEERLHAQAMLNASVPTSFLWRVPPGSELPATLEIWLPTSADGSVADVLVEVVAPDGRLASDAGHRDVAKAPDASAAVVSTASTSWRGVGCTLSVIRLAPTQAPGGRARAISGDWTVRLTAAATLQAQVHLYIARIKQALGFPLRTAQSFFVSTGRPGYVGPAGQGTLQGLATAAGVTAVGGVVGRGDDPPPSRYSSRGPSRDGSMVGPELSVKADDGSVLRGRRSIGNRSGVTFRMDGTSVAAPLAARLHTEQATEEPPTGLHDQNACGKLVRESRKALDDETP